MVKVLIVDDEESIRRIIRETLEVEGYEILEAGNGIEAIEIYTQNPSDIVITDIIMPKKEGIETIMELRRINPAVKIIAMSGTGLDSPYLLMAKHLGANCILDKPFSPNELIETIKIILKK